MTWQSVGTHTFMPTDTAVEVGSFDLAAGQDTIWVRITQLNPVDEWPFSYGILSWRNANGAPLGSIKAYSNRFGEVFRLGNGLPPSDGTGSIWFEPRGFNLGWLKAGFPWELQFEAQAGASDLTSGYWNRDPNSGVITPKTSGDNLDMTPGWIKASNLIITDNGGGSDDRDVPGYQQGTWTPFMSIGGCTPQECTYSRIGNQVSLAANITAIQETDSNSLIEVRGIPYPRNDQFVVGAIRSSYLNFGEGNTIVAGVVAGNRVRVATSTPSLGGTPATANSWVTYQRFITAEKDGNSLVFAITYFTDDTTWQPGSYG